MILLLLAATAAAADLEPLSSEAQSWLAANRGRRIRLAVEANYPPVIFAEAGEVRGISMDIVHLIEQKVGLEFEILQPRPLAEILAAVHRGEVDVVTSLQQTPVREGFLEFTCPYVELPLVILVRDGTTGLGSVSQLVEAGASVAIGEGFAVGEYLAHWPQLKLTTFADDRVCLETLAAGRIDAVVADLAVASYYVEHLGITNLKVAGEMDFTYNLSLATRRGVPHLREVLEFGLMSITDGERRQIHRRWISLEVDRGVPWRAFWKVLGVMVGLLLWLGFWAWALRRRVERRTQQLRQELAQRERIEIALLESERKLARSERLEFIGMLAGGVAHDLNNTLGPIVALPDLIAADVRSLAGRSQGSKDREQAIQAICEDLRVISSSAQRAAAVIRDLTSFSRQGNVVKVPTDLSKLVREFLGSPDVERIVGSRPEIQLRLDIAPDPPLVAGSSLHLERVVENLLRNAREAIGEGGGVITIGTGREHLDQPWHGYETVPPGDYVFLRVSDTGRGIAPADLEQVFDPFFSRKAGGGVGSRGLGLAVVHGVVKDHEGYLDATSDPATGTSFTMFLPITAGEAELPVRHTDAGGDERILVIDDSPAQQSLARRALEGQGYHVTGLSRPADAIALFEKALAEGEGPPFDLVLLDMIMEGGDGDGLVALRELIRLEPALRAIIVSGFAAPDDVAAARELGAGWLPKPYEAAELTHAVRQELGRKRRAP